MTKVKVPSKIVKDDNLNFVLLLFSKENMFDISCELSAKLTVHMNCHALFSLKEKNNILE